MRSAPSQTGEEVRLGQHYRMRGTNFTTWEVAGFVQFEDEPFAHVRMVRVGSYSDQKTVSAAVLGDRKLYVSVKK